MDKIRLAKRKRLKELQTISEYERLKQSILLTDTESKIMDYIYVNGFDYMSIADRMGYSESNIKRIERIILDKMKEG